MADLSVEILKQIRNEGRRTNERLDIAIERIDQTVQRLDQTNERLDQTVQRLDRLERRQVESEVRLITELTAVASAVNGLRDDLLADRNLRNDVANHEARIQRLEAKG